MPWKLWLAANLFFPLISFEHCWKKLTIWLLSFPHEKHIWFTVCFPWELCRNAKVSNHVRWKLPFFWLPNLETRLTNAGRICWQWRYLTGRLMLIFSWIRITCQWKETGEVYLCYAAVPILHRIHQILTFFPPLRNWRIRIRCKVSQHQYIHKTRCLLRSQNKWLRSNQSTLCVCPSQLKSYWGNENHNMKIPLRNY